MRNLKNINHWIAELREIAIKAEVYNEGELEPMTKKQVYELFNIDRFKQQFEEGLTPQETFNEEMEFWMDAL